ncbi:MAG: alpha/beta hydrolase [Bacteroidia bacterium]
MRTCFLLLLGYAAILLLVYCLQEKLIFHPRPITLQKADSISSLNKNAEAISFTMSDGKKVKGWIVRADTLSTAPLLIYYGGNAEEISHWVSKSNRFRGWTLALVNYRGYGLSEGEPSEKVLFSDALEVFDLLKKRGDVFREKIVVIGRSLGTGVATYVSSQRPVNATILITPYESMADLAQEKYPFIPVSPFLKHPFNSIGMAPLIHTPLLTLIASEDEMIPPPHAEKLAKKWGGRTKVITIQGEDHGTILRSEKCFEEIGKFLFQLQ